MDGGGGGAQISGGSSSEDDAEWRATIDSIVSTTTFGTSTSGRRASTSNGTRSNSIGHPAEQDQLESRNPPPLKHYQIKAQQILDEIIEKNIEIVRKPIDAADNDNHPVANEGGIRLFKHAPPGIVFDRKDEFRGPRKRPKILPGEEINKKSKKFRRQLQSVVVDGMDIIAAAKDACQKSLAKLEAKEAAAKAAAKREEERVAELKKIRGERWLPSIAKHMQSKRS